MIYLNDLFGIRLSFIIWAKEKWSDNDLLHLRFVFMWYVV